MTERIAGGNDAARRRNGAGEHGSIPGKCGEAFAFLNIPYLEVYWFSRNAAQWLGHTI